MTMANKIVARLALALFVYPMLSGGCSRIVDDGDRVTTISGKVRDSTTTSPIDSAIVMVDDTTTSFKAYTDTTGEYTAAEFGYGTYRVFCLKEGYKTKWKDVQSTKDNRILKDVNLELSK
jgi:hypothetical protein